MRDDRLATEIVEGLRPFPATEAIEGVAEALERRFRERSKRSGSGK
jgi:hypothetical protein